MVDSICSMSQVKPSSGGKLEAFRGSSVLTSSTASCSVLHKACAANPSTRLDSPAFLPIGNHHCQPDLALARDSFAGTSDPLGVPSVVQGLLKPTQKDFPFHIFYRNVPLPPHHFQSESKEGTAPICCCRSTGASLCYLFLLHFQMCMW